jgi:hypothetical protein
MDVQRYLGTMRDLDKEEIEADRKKRAKEGGAASAESLSKEGKKRAKEGGAASAESLSKEGI